jgi:hypothetical protein
MSAPTVTFINTTYTNGTNTLIVGDIRVVTPLPGAIDIKPIGNQVPSHFVLQKGDDNEFKQIMKNSPVRPFDITLYDNDGNITCNYPADRQDNTPGTVEIKTDKDLLSEIRFRETSGQTYLIITHYNGLNQLNVFESKQSLVSQDLERLRQNTDTKKIILFISDEINKEINALGINLCETFQNVISMPIGKQIRYLVEYLVGKSVSGSKPSYQGMIKFGSNNLDNVEKIQVTFTRFTQFDDTKYSGLANAIRRNGRIQINSESNVAHSRFLIMLKHPENPELTISEEMNGIEFPVTHRTVENMPDITDLQLNALIDSHLFYEKFDAKDFNFLTKFMTENYADAGKYIFASPLSSFDSIVSESETSTMIIEYGYYLQSQIYQLLMNYASAVNGRRPKSTKRKLLFMESYMSGCSSFPSHPPMRGNQQIYTRAPNITSYVTNFD